MSRQTALLALRAVGAAATGLLLASLFAPLAWGDAAWVALVPLLLALRFAAPRESWWLGFGAGAVFWLLTLSWLTHVTLVGWILLCLYCAVYPGLFALLIHAWLSSRGVGRFRENLGFIFLAAVLWTGLEWMRSHFLSGFGWNPLGLALQDQLLLFQLASWGGVALLSALLVWVNAAVAVVLLRGLEGRPRRMQGELMAGLLAPVLAIAAGAWIWRQPPPTTVPLRAALIQPAIPQTEKWTQETVDTIYDRLRDLTEAALHSGADLLIWPETALPDDLLYSPESFELVTELSRRGTPLLVGTMDRETADDGVTRYYNSAMLFDGQGRLLETYDKQHLVAFGEYVPFHEVVPFFQAMTPIQESFSPGRTGTVFRLQTPQVGFSVLICFEDTVAELARRAVRGGARLLVNQTNDAWFDPSSASRQHMAHSRLRAVENGVPVVRCANTGVSCHIDARGRVREILREADGSCLFPGVRMTRVDVPPADAPWTFYTRHGEVLGQGCAVFAGLALLAEFAARRRARRAA